MNRVDLIRSPILAEEYYHTKTYEAFYKENKTRIDTLQKKIIEKNGYSKSDIRKLVQFLHQNRHVSSYSKDGQKSTSQGPMSISDFEEICYQLSSLLNKKQLSSIISIFETTIIESKKALNDLYLLEYLICSSTQSELKKNILESYRISPLPPPKENGTSSKKRQIILGKNQPNDIKVKIHSMCHYLVENLVFIESLANFYPKEINKTVSKLMRKEIENALKRITKNLTSYNNNDKDSFNSLFYYFLNKFYKKNASSFKNFSNNLEFIDNITYLFLLNSPQLNQKEIIHGLGAETIRKQIQKGARLSKSPHVVFKDSALIKRIQSLDSKLD